MKKKLSITMDSIIDERLNRYVKSNQKVKSQVIEQAVSEYLEKEHKKMEKVEKQQAYINDTQPERLKKLKAYVDDTDVEKYLKKFVDDMQEDKK